MPRLPQPGGDTGNWGTILNQFLMMSHTPEGDLKPGIVQSSHLASNTVTTTNLANASVSSVKLASSVGDSLDSSLKLTNLGQAGGMASLDDSGKVPFNQLPVSTADNIVDATGTTKGIVQLSGSLGGSASSPRVASLNGVSVSGTPSSGSILSAVSATSAQWKASTTTPSSSTGNIWTPTTEPTSSQGVKNGDLWVDTTSDTGNILTKARINNVWVVMLTTPKPAADPDPDPTTPDAPTNAAQSDLTDTSVVLSWTAPSAVVDGYNIYNGTTKLNTALVTDTTYTVTGLDAGTDYTFTIRSVSGTTESSTGAAIAVKTTGETDPDPDPTVPDAPTNVTATAGDGEATISFDGSAGATSYTVTSSPGGITATGTTPPITVSGLTNGTEYTFTVTASNAAGVSGESDASGAVTPMGVEPEPTDDNITSLTLTPATNYIDISWSAPESPSGTVEGYNIYLDDQKNNDTVISETTFRVADLTPATTYTVKVTTVVDSNESTGVSDETTTLAQVDPGTSYLTGGSGGSFLDTENQSYTGAGSTSKYHLYAADVSSDGDTPLGLVLQFHGDGAYEFNNPDATYSLGGSNGVRQVAIDNNMLCVPCLTPDSDTTWWSSGNSNADWVASLIETVIYPKYNIDRSRIWLSGYSGGAQFISQYLVPEYSELFVDGGAVISGGGGKPGGNSDPSTINTFADHFKQNFFMHWYTYQGDTGWDDDGYNAYADAQRGQQWYIDNGFLETSNNFPAGGGHSSVTTKFGAELRAKMQEKYGA